ncbi:hypothetical protein [Prescottella equi]|uniref:hypothetical protein n=1 Tax=Rhodococcus hoagii TaxID=43767 RepID=UPI000A10AAD9|nr:hypothetical protein [Prescottella equi]
MTIELPTGVTVRVEFPQMPQVCRAPEAPQPGGVTVPVQGGLTAEQLAHIVATVTAKVVEELGGQPGNVSWEAVQGKPAVFPPEAHRHNAADIDGLPSGGGGAGIDDTTIGTDTTWSSQKTSDELAGKADDKSWVIDMATGELLDGPFPSLAYQVAVAYTWASMGLRAESEFGGTVNGVEIASALPEYPNSGTLYGIRDSVTGAVSWFMPNVWT